jgi:hypothetical protein
MICKCGKEIPERRVKLGYKTCVQYSNEPKWSANPLTFHKTGNTIEVIKDPELAAEINYMAQRRNYGVMKGVTGSYKRNKPVTPRKPKQKKLSDYSKLLKREPVDPSRYKFHEVLNEAAKLYDQGKTMDDLSTYLSEQIQKLRISPDQKKQILTLIEYVSI